MAIDETGRDDSEAKGASVTQAMGLGVGRLVAAGEYWTITYDGTVCRVKDSKGLRYLAVLLANPAQSVAAVALQVAAAGEEPRSRRDGTAEQARVSVTRAIRAAVERVGLQHAALGEHLRSTIRTGSSCAYVPDPRVTVRWETVPIRKFDSPA